MQNNIDTGNIYSLLNMYDSKSISLKDLGIRLSEEIKNNNGDVAYVESEIYHSILEANGVDVKGNPNQYALDALVWSHLGTKVEPALPRERGTFTSFRRSAFWEDPKWLSGKHAWKESAYRRYFEHSTGEEIDDFTVRNKVVKSSDVEMVVAWERRTTPHPIDVLVWKEYDEDDNLVAINHVLHVNNIPVYSYTESTDDDENEDIDRDSSMSPFYIDYIDNGHHCLYTVSFYGTAIVSYKVKDGEITKI